MLYVFNCLICCLFFFVLILFVRLVVLLLPFLFFFFKQKPAYELRISDWSSDVCSSDLVTVRSVIFSNFCRRSAVSSPRREKASATLPCAVACSDRSLPGRTPISSALGPVMVLRTVTVRPITRDRTASSEERRLGAESGSSVRSRWAPDD